MPHIFCFLLLLLNTSYDNFFILLCVVLAVDDIFFTFLQLLRNRNLVDSRNFHFRIVTSEKGYRRGIGPERSWCLSAVRAGCLLTMCWQSFWPLCDMHIYFFSFLLRALWRSAHKWNNIVCVGAFICHNWHVTNTHKHMSVSVLAKREKDRGDICLLLSPLLLSICQKLKML